MSKLQELKDKLNIKVTLAGGAIVVATTFGTCHFVGGEDGAQTTEPVEEPAPAEEPAEKAEPPTEGATEPA